MERAPDTAIWHFAKEHAAAIVTKDQDFAALHASRRERVIVIWVRIGNTTTPYLLEALSFAWPAVIAAIESHETLIEVL